jgi:uracil-DNA glycosylase family protein
LKRKPADDRIEPTTLDALNAMIAASKPLVPGAARAVLGEGTVGASIAFVGEQPGDQEDRLGRPFVGPAGQLLDRAMSDAGIDRHRVYVTNAIKHFKFEQRGKRRIHQKPTAGEVKHYRWWLDQELRLVHPKLVVALGATATLALAGKPLPIAKFRGPGTVRWPRRLHHGPSLASAARARQDRQGAGVSGVRQGPPKHPQNCECAPELARSGACRARQGSRSTFSPCWRS